MTDQPEYTGGSVSYYTCSVTHPISETADPYDAECIDLIDALQMTPNEANAFKALWRRAAARLGKSKRGYTDGLYDAEKVEFYGKRLVELERRGRTVEEPDPIVKKQVDKILKGEVSFPEGVIGACIEKVVESAAVDVAREALKPENQRVEPVTSHSVPRPAGDGWRGEHLPGPRDMEQRVEYVSIHGCATPRIGLGSHFAWSDVAWWRFAPAADPFGPRDADGWYSWNGDDTMRPAGRVDVVRRDGEFIGKRSAENEVRWRFTKEADGLDVVKWRPAMW